MPYGLYKYRMRRKYRPRSYRSRIYKRPYYRRSSRYSRRKAPMYRRRFVRAKRRTKRTALKYHKAITEKKEHVVKFSAWDLAATAPSVSNGAGSIVVYGGAVPLDIQPASFTGVGTFCPLNNIVIGSKYTERDGNKIRLTSMRCWGAFGIYNESTSGIFREFYDGDIDAIANWHWQADARMFYYSDITSMYFPSVPIVTLYIWQQVGYTNNYTDTIPVVRPAAFMKFIRSPLTTMDNPTNATEIIQTASMRVRYTNQEMIDGQPKGWRLLGIKHVRIEPPQYGSNRGFGGTYNFKIKLAQKVVEWERDNPSAYLTGAVIIEAKTNFPRSNGLTTPALRVTGRMNVRMRYQDV